MRKCDLFNQFFWHKNATPPPLQKTVLLFTFFTLLSFNGIAQSVTLKASKQPLLQVLKQVRKQTGYDYAFSSTLVQKAQPVTIALNNVPLADALKRIFDAQPFTYELKEKTIIVKERPAPPNEVKRIDAPVSTVVSGRVVNEQGDPLANATVAIKGTIISVTTNSEGVFKLPTSFAKARLVASYIGYTSTEMDAMDNVTITLYQTISQLDETIVIAYGTTSQRFNTGAVGRITAKEIERQPVTNPLAALSGRIPGLVVVQSSGQAGASFNVQIRGRNSIDQNSDPLFIVDGVPFAANNDNISQVGNPAAYGLGGKTGGISPFNSLNPNDIESIEVLKDADATAIYGSRGANGVILITTKKGKSGRTKFDLGFQSGLSKVSQQVKMMDTRQYIAMRKEAFKNDGVIMTNANAFDVLLWDTTRNTDWGKKLIGGTATINDLRASISGGNENTQFLIAGNYRHETTVFPGDLYYKRGGIQTNINHTSSNKRLTIALSANYGIDENRNASGNLAAQILTILPHTSGPYDSLGRLVWSESGYAFANPFSLVESYYLNKTNSLISNLQVSYKVFNNLRVQINSGFNRLDVDEIQAMPISSRDPATNPTGSAQFGKNNIRSFIIEPQIHYSRQSKGKRLEVLLGATYQQNISQGNFILANGFTSDALLKSVSAAATLNATNSYNEYRYAATFGRINYNIDNTYLINLTGRRDGSSRFGPGRQWANFGALGAGWIFSNLPLFSNHSMQWLSFGKIRGSFGIAGNDGIGNYQYLDTYSNTSNQYDGKAGLVPTRLFNADYGWETNKKIELALELGFMKDRILLTTSWYRNRSDNQLVNYTLPTQTGFSGVIQNLAALIQNRGLEISTTTTNIKTSNFTWKTDINISFPDNKLLKFPGLEASTYRNRYVIGKSLNIGSGYITAGVDTETGLFNFVDSLGHVSSTPTNRIIALVNLDPRYLGGINNEFQYKGWTFSAFFEFRKQIGYSAFHNIGNITPGLRANRPLEFINAWHDQGDITPYPKYTQATSSAVYRTNSLIQSNGADVRYTDASFVRVRNMYLGYSTNSRLLSRTKLSRLNIFLQGQNLFIFTKYKNGNPEIQLASILAPLKSVTAGIQVSL